MIHFELGCFEFYFCYVKILNHFTDNPYKRKALCIVWKNKPLINWNFS